MLPAYATHQYQEMQVQTTPGKLVVMLYDGALRFCHCGLEAMRRGDLAAQGTNLGKAQNILCHLNATLDPSAGEIAHQLGGIYRYCLERLLFANAEDRPEYVEEVVALLTPLRDAWEQADRTVRTEQARAGQGVLEGAAA
jgi:flagellar secretion chaperone FliS